MTRDGERGSEGAGNEEISEFKRFFGQEGKETERAIRVRMEERREQRAESREGEEGFTFIL